MIVGDRIVEESGRLRPDVEAIAKFARQFLRTIGKSHPTLRQKDSAFFGVYNATNPFMTLKRFKTMRGTHDRAIAVEAFRYYRKLNNLSVKQMEREFRKAFDNKSLLTEEEV